MLCGCFIIACFLQKCKKLQSHCKATAKKTAKLSNATLSMFSLFFVFCFCSFAVIEICIQKTGRVGLGVGWGRVGLEDQFLQKTAKLQRILPSP